MNGNHTFRFRTHIHHDRIVIHLHNGSPNHVARHQLLEAVLEQIGEILLHFTVLQPHYFLFSTVLFFVNHENLTP